MAIYILNSTCFQDVKQEEEDIIDLRGPARASLLRRLRVGEDAGRNQNGRSALKLKRKTDLEPGDSHFHTCSKIKPIFPYISSHLDNPTILIFVSNVGLGYTWRSLANPSAICTQPRGRTNHVQRAGGSKSQPCDMFCFDMRSFLSNKLWQRSVEECEGYVQ